MVERKLEKFSKKKILNLTTKIPGVSKLESPYVDKKRSNEENKEKRIIERRNAPGSRGNN